MMLTDWIWSRTREKDSRSTLFLILCFAGLLVFGADSVMQRSLAAPPACIAQNSETKQNEQAALTELRSSRFALHTDLDGPRAKDLLSRMEATLRIAATYWGRDPRGQIDCYVVEHLDNCHDDQLPHPLSRVWIGGVEGTTLRFQEGAGRTVRSRATVYASARTGVAEHEVVHAYCSQTFGQEGPDWYKEGMAQFLAAGDPNAGDSGCPPIMVHAIHRQPQQTLEQVVRAGRFTAKLSESFRAMLNDRTDTSLHVALNQWTPQDAENVRQVKQQYAWSWALCHMLAHNPNYAERFRTLGESYLLHGVEGDCFERLFAARGAELMFEFGFYVQHMKPGYRVDLCSWDWDTHFRPARQGKVLCKTIVADRGFQASGATLVKGHRYAFTCDGAWITGHDGKAVSADGASCGAGRMVGAILDGYCLGKPFELGRHGSFVAARSGNLYLRCQDAWNSLADNHGSIRVRLTRHEHP